MKLLEQIKNYLLYYGKKKSEYENIEKNIFISNFRVWKKLIFLFMFIFLVLTVYTAITSEFDTNGVFYTYMLLYFVVAFILFYFVFKDYSRVAQVFIYIGVSLLYVLGTMLSFARPDMMAVTLCALIVVLPLLTISRPVFLYALFIVLDVMYFILVGYYKEGFVVRADKVNIIVFTFASFILLGLVNIPRINEFILRDEIEKERDIDFTTGLYNKSGITRYLDSYLDENAPGILMFLDLDNFKEINDTYGHKTGDNVLIAFGKYLDSKFDSKTCMTGRFGGDEFVVFIKNSDDLENAKKLSTEIIEYLNAGSLTPRSKVKLGISIGITKIENDKNYESILKRADKALYKAKELGKNQYYL